MRDREVTVAALTRDTIIGQQTAAFEQEARVKDREREADYYGLYLAAYGGFDIDGAPELWRTFALETGGGSGGLTHPSSPERSARAMLVVVDVAHKKRDAKPLLPDELPAAAAGETNKSATKTNEGRAE